MVKDCLKVRLHSQELLEFLLSSLIISFPQLSWFRNDGAFCPDIHDLLEPPAASYLIAESTEVWSLDCDQQSSSNSFGCPLTVIEGTRLRGVGLVVSGSCESKGCWGCRERSLCANRRHPAITAKMTKRTMDEMTRAVVFAPWSARLSGPWPRSGFDCMLVFFSG